MMFEVAQWQSNRLQRLWVSSPTLGAIEFIAGMAELADARDLKSREKFSYRVRPRFPAPIIDIAG